ncbi:hypothetical protein WBJ53_26215 [Spirosoma sp. SC4-14]|uniref:hypothetical protein n=1 Tax=Spirosoma sp. SC4-14 TaxID=3128900 RepID=UPI0030D33ED0
MKNLFFIYISIIILGIGLVIVGAVALLRTLKKEKEAETLLQLVVTPAQDEALILDKTPEWDLQWESRRKFNERLAAWKEQKKMVDATKQEVDRILLERMHITDDIASCKTPESVQALRERLRLAQDSFDTAIAGYDAELKKLKAILVDE